MAISNHTGRSLTPLRRLSSVNDGKAGASLALASAREARGGISRALGAAMACTHRSAFGPAWRIRASGLGGLTEDSERYAGGMRWHEACVGEQPYSPCRPESLTTKKHKEV